MVYYVSNQEIDNIKNIKKFNYLKLITALVIYLYFFKNKYLFSSNCFKMVSISFLIIFIFSIISNILLTFNRELGSVIKYINYSLIFKIAESSFFFLDILLVYIYESKKGIIFSFIIDFIVIFIMNMTEIFKIYELIKNVKMNMEIIQNSNTRHIEIRKKKNTLLIAIEIKKYEKKYLQNILDEEKKDSYICTICQEKILNKKCCTTNCNHCFHSECLIKWLKEKHNCPLCRKEILYKKNNNIEISVI
jgi:hypothetical protein